MSKQFPPSHGLEQYFIKVNIQASRERGGREKERVRQTDRPTDRLTDRQTDTNRQRNRQTDRGRERVGGR